MKHNNKYYFLSSHRTTVGNVSREEIFECVRHYGFTECADIIKFLHIFNRELMSTAELIFLLEKTKECLNNHDNQSCYFIPLRKLHQDIIKKIHQTKPDYLPSPGK